MSIAEVRHLILGSSLSELSVKLEQLQEDITAHDAFVEEALITINKNILQLMKQHNIEPDTSTSIFDSIDKPDERY